MRTRPLSLLIVLAVGLTACSSAASDTTSTGHRATTTAARASIGCRSASAPPGRTVVTIQSDGRARSYIRYVPKHASRSKPAPLVIDFTAYSPATMQESFSGFTKPDAHGKVKADEVGAVVVTPEPVNGKGLLTWNVDHTAGWTDDQQLVADMITNVGAHTCIDRSRVLAMGFAIGAVMASTVACEHPQLITVMATVSGLWNPPGCRPTKPVPVVSLHGTDDHFLPYDGGVGDRIGMLGLTSETTAGLTAMASRPSEPAAASAWAARNGCRARPTNRAVNNTVRRTTWSGCKADVELFTIADAGHTWPGSNGMGSYESLLGPVSHAIDANDVIWSFFVAHTRA